MTTSYPPHGDYSRKQKKMNRMAAGIKQGYERWSRPRPWYVTVIVLILVIAFMVIYHTARSDGATQSEAPGKVQVQFS